MKKYNLILFIFGVIAVMFVLISCNSRKTSACFVKETDRIEKIIYSGWMFQGPILYLECGKGSMKIQINEKVDYLKKINYAGEEIKISFSGESKSNPILVPSYCCDYCQSQSKVHKAVKLKNKGYTLYRPRYKIKTLICRRKVKNENDVFYTKSYVIWSCGKIGKSRNCQESAPNK